MCLLSRVSHEKGPLSLISTQSQQGNAILAHDPSNVIENPWTTRIFVRGSGEAESREEFRATSSVFSYLTGHPDEARGSFCDLEQQEPRLPTGYRIKKLPKNPRAAQKYLRWPCSQGTLE